LFFNIAFKLLKISPCDRVICSIYIEINSLWQRMVMETADLSARPWWKFFSEFLYELKHFSEILRKVYIFS